jgi:hypothetical protein
MQELSKFEKECISLSHLHMQEAAFHLMQGDYFEALAAVATARYNINLFVSAIRQKQHPKRECEVCNV